MEAKHSAKDRISTLPQNIIETILCDLHIRDAVRTSVLSKNWRYSWTGVPKLVFVEDTFEKLTGGQLSVMEQEVEMQSPGNLSRMLKKCKFNAIYQVLLMHQGPTQQFTLDMEACECDECFEIDQIILHLSRSNTVTELKLHLPTRETDPYEIPLSIYSLHQLTNLHLHDCNITHQPTFSGFGSLTTLCLEEVSIYAKTLLHLLSKSPRLKRVTLSLYFFYDDDDIPVMELFKCLPLIEHITTAKEFMCMCLMEDGVPQKLPISLVHLKYVSLEDTSFFSNHGFLVLLIKSSPNLEKINLQNREIHRRELYIETNPVTLEDYSDISLEHLYELNIEYFENLKTELEFVKLILAKSPVLKKARIVLYDWVTKEEERQLLTTLLRSPSVSPVVEIVVERPS